MCPRNYIKTLVDPGVDKATVLKPKQFKHLLLIAGEGYNGLRNKSIIWHSFGSALRVTEIAQLTPKDVMEKNGDIKKLGKLPGPYTKNGKPRMFLQLEDAQIEALENYIQYRVDMKLRYVGGKHWRGLQGDSPLYLARGVSGFCMTRKVYKKADGTIAEYDVCSSLQQLITRLIKSVGVKDGSSHSGRRTFASRLHDRGIEEELIQLLLGHGDLNQTMNYIDVNTTKVQKALGRVYPGL